MFKDKLKLMVQREQAISKGSFCIISDTEAQKLNGGCGRYKSCNYYLATPGECGRLKNCNFYGVL